MLEFIKENSLVEVYPSIILLYIINNKYNIFNLIKNHGNPCAYNKC